MARYARRLSRVRFALALALLVAVGCETDHDRCLKQCHETRVSCTGACVPACKGEDKCISRCQNACFDDVDRCMLGCR